MIFMVKPFEISSSLAFSIIKPPND